MEKKINTKIESYLDDFKQNIKSWIEENENINFNAKSELLKFIFDYNKLNLEKEDFSKRKRLKSNVPQYLRCMAKRANESNVRERKNLNLIFAVHTIKIDRMES